jgi:hypothetical protein
VLLFIEEKFKRAALEVQEYVRLVSAAFRGIPPPMPASIVNSSTRLLMQSLQSAADRILQVRCWPFRAA